MYVCSGPMTVIKDHVPDGYIIVKNAKPKWGVKYRVMVSNGNQSLYYSIREEAVFPLQFGDGRYTVRLYRQRIENKYTEVGKISFNAKLNFPTAPYLHPNQMVDYTRDSPCVLKAAELCTGLSTPEEKFEAIAKYVVGKTQYNYIKAVLVARSTNVLPNVDECFTKRSGICQDIAAMMVAMLRSQGVPASLVVGLCCTSPHAWVKVYFDKAGTKTKDYDPTRKIQKDKTILFYTPQRWY